MATTTNFGWETPDDTDLVKDGALAIRTLGSAIDTSLVDLKGGTTGQVLSKASNTDMDFTWVTSDDANAIQNAIVDAKGDLIAATAADTPARLAVGNNGYVLTADSTTATGLKWAAPAGGGKVLQVVSTTYATSTTSNSTSYTDTGLSLSITPTLNTSKILVLVSQPIVLYRETNVVRGSVNLVRGATEIVNNPTNVIKFQGNTLTLVIGTVYFNLAYLDSPNTTSSTTYKTRMRLESSADSATIYAQDSSGVSMMTLLEIGA